MRIHGEFKLLRRTGIQNLTDYKKYWDFLREDFSHICGYCGKSDTIVVSRGFEIDHFVPQKIDENRINDYTNLVYSCFTCNRKKHVKWPTKDKSIYNDGVSGFIDPICKEYDEHLSRNEKGEIIPLSEVGKYMCEVAFEFNKRPISQIWKIMELNKAKKKLANLREKLSAEEMQLYIQIDDEIENLQQFIVNKRE